MTFYVLMVIFLYVKDVLLCGYDDFIMSPFFYVMKHSLCGELTFFVTKITFYVVQMTFRVTKIIFMGHDNILCC